MTTTTDDPTVLMLWVGFGRFGSIMRDRRRASAGGFWGRSTGVGGVSPSPRRARAQRATTKTLSLSFSRRRAQHAPFTQHTLLLLHTRAHDTTPQQTTAPRARARERESRALTLALSLLVLPRARAISTKEELAHTSAHNLERPSP
jgi:hypothetical protein